MTRPADSAARDEILRVIRTTLARRRASGETPHPGPFQGSRPIDTPPPMEQFRTMFQSAGGEVVQLPDEEAARGWVADLDVASVCLGADVPEGWASNRRIVDPSAADAAISFSRAAIAETGTLVLDSRGGRRVQLLAPTHVIVVAAGDIHATLADALAHLKADLPAALGLHSGPSKSADIGQVMVRGVHGPGRVIALVLGGEPS